jgi:hypothetical protein
MPSLRATGSRDVLEQIQQKITRLLASIFTDIQTRAKSQDLLYLEVVRIGHFPKKLKICVMSLSVHMLNVK